MGVTSRLSSGMEAGQPPPETEQVAGKPDLENGGSCNSGDEGIDTTEPVDEIDGNETDEHVGESQENDNDTSGSNDKIEENGSSDLNPEEEPVDEIANQEEELVDEETIETGTEEDMVALEKEENGDNTTPLMEEQEKNPREILLEKRCSLTHTPDIGRVLDREAGKASGEVHEFQKVKNELKALEEPQDAELKISQTHEGVSGETGQSENHFLPSDITESDFEEVTKDAAEEEEVEEVAETTIELTLAPSPMIMDLTPAPVEFVKDTEPTEKNGGKDVNMKQEGEIPKQTRDGKNALRAKNKKNQKEDTDKKKTGGVKRQVPDTNKEGATGKAGRKAGKENQGDGKSSKTRIREQTLERDDMLGTKKGDGSQKKISVGSNKDPEVLEGGLMRPTKAWLNHLGDQQANPARQRSPSPRRRPSRSSAQSSKPPPGTGGEGGPRRSSSQRAKTPRSEGRRASSATDTKTAVEAPNENGCEAGRAIRAKSPRKKTGKSPPPVVPPKPSVESEEGVVEETISAGEAIIKFETESAAFAAVGGHDNAANGKESEIKSRKKTDESQLEKQETGIEVATTETGAGPAAVNGKTSRRTRTSQGSKTRSVSVSSSRKSGKGSTSGADSSKDGAEASKKSSVVSGVGEMGLMRPTKSWLNHLGETTAGGMTTKVSSTVNGNATQPGSSAEEGTTARTRKTSSQKPNPDSSSSSSLSSSSGDKMLTSSTSSSSESSSSGKSKPLICQNGVVGGKEVHKTTEINGENESGKRTTMVIRLHPGKTNKLSAYLENQEKPGSQTWLTESQEVEDVACGLEISFSSTPQDIEIKLPPPTEGDENLQNIEKN